VRVLFEIKGEAERTISHRIYDTIYHDQMAELVLWWPLCDAHVASLHVMIYLRKRDCLDFISAIKQHPTNSDRACRQSVNVPNRLTHYSKVRSRG
jgi:hypothetical protein